MESRHKASISDIPSTGDSSICNKHALDSQTHIRKDEQSLDMSQGHCNSSLSAQHIDLMPSSRLEIPLSVKQQKLIDTFKQTSRKHRFKVSEESGNSLLVTYQHGFKLSSLLSCCLESPDIEFTTSASFSVYINERKCVRQLEIKGVYGNPLLTAALIEDYSAKVKDISAMSKPMSYEELEDEEEYVITCKQETISYYEIFKILSTETYSLGQSIGEFLRSFNSQYRNSAETADLLPHPTESIKNKVEETVTALFSDYNYGRPSAERIMVYCRPAVEKFVFGKITPTLIEAYRAKYKESDTALEETRTSSKEQEDLYESLGISVCASYTSVIEEINKIPSLIGPREKLNCLLRALDEAKSQTLDFTGGEFELNVMDESRVISYAIIQSSACCLCSEVMMLKDWEPEDETGILAVFTDAFRLLGFLF